MQHSPATVRGLPGRGAGRNDPRHRWVQLQAVEQEAPVGVQGYLVDRVGLGGGPLLRLPGDDIHDAYVVRLSFPRGAPGAGGGGGVTEYLPVAADRQVVDLSPGNGRPGLQRGHRGRPPVAVHPELIQPRPAGIGPIERYHVRSAVSGRHAADVCAAIVSGLAGRLAARFGWQADLRNDSPRGYVAYLQRRGSSAVGDRELQRCLPGRRRWAGPTRRAPKASGLSGCQTFWAWSRAAS
jgi:hypothetical protein